MRVRESGGQCTRYARIAAQGERLASGRAGRGMGVCGGATHVAPLVTSMREVGGPFGAGDRARAGAAALARCVAAVEARD